uniref:carboxypeptidase-like regulatory domain-containing protein n=1 Tax=Phocaeicola sp. TaxID=2773926 RepID=UPI003FF0B850
MRIRTFARSVCILGMGIVATALHAENIKGQISDKTTGEPLVGALVKVVGSTQGGVTDIDGHYQLRQLPAGTYTLEVTYVGYRTLQVPDVRLDGKDLSLDIQLDPDTQELEEVMVTARKNLEGEKALMMERQQASFAIENMGAKEMSLKGVGNVQEGLTKITGISVADAGQLIVRGLGDRYSTT